MRHIPDEELHAYLDQALSRSQCVEIECHLSACALCRDGRDGIASLRDRTTALLRLLAPRSVIAPAFSSLAVRRPSVARRRIVPTRRFVGWAASVAGALITGLALHSFLDQQTASSETMVASATPVVPEIFAAPSGLSEPIPLPPPSPVERGTPVRLAEQPAVQASSTSSRIDVRPLPGDGDVDLEFDGLWKTVSWEEAEALTQNLVPRITGLPVLEVRIQQGAVDERPVIIVAQQHSSGAIVRIVEGPVGQVADLLTRQGDLTSGRLFTSAPARSRPDYLNDRNGLPQRGLRVMTVAGGLSTDTLNALSRRLTLR